jgi:hypothetical protein
VIADDRHGRLIAQLAALAPDEPSLSQICRGSVALLDLSGAAVILMSEEEPGALAGAFGARVAEVADLQFVLGEGPCLEAFRDGAPVLVPDLLGASAERWPEFARQAVGLGARAVFALPLQLGAIRLGVLYLYRDRAGMLSGDQLADGFDLAELAMLTVLELQSHAPPGELGAGLGDDWAHRAVVHQATGLVSAQLDTKLADALARIRAHAFANGRPIYHVAAEIVSGLLRLQR